MNSVVTLSRHSLRRIRPILLGLGLLLAVFEFLLTQVGAYLVRHSAFGELSMLMPEFVRNVAGPAALAFMSFTGIVALGYFHPMVIAGTVGLAIAIASEPAAEIESRFVDLTLSRELTRAAVVTRTAVVFLLAAAAILALMMLGTAAGLSCCAPADAAVPATLVLSLAASLGALMVCWAGVTLAIAAAVRRRAVVGATAGLAALAAFLLDYLGRAWEPARRISTMSPFHYFDPTTLIMGAPLNRTNIGVLLAIGTAGAVVAFVVFNQRDI